MEIMYKQLVSRDDMLSAKFMFYVSYLCVYVVGNTTFSMYNAFVLCLSQSP